MTIPKKPRTTEGRNPKISRVGFNMFLNVLGHTSDKNKDTKMLIGRAMREDKRVTAKEPAIKGSMPNSGGE